MRVKDRATAMGNTVACSLIIIELKDDGLHRVSAGKPQVCTKIEVHSYL